MGFYEEFSKYYDLIFQAKKPQLDFIKKRTPKKGKILDVAAGTGNHALALGEEGYDLRAVEYDETMLEELEEKLEKRNIEKRNLEKENLDVIARRGDMKEIRSYYPENFFDTLYCIGNSLVHLTTVEEIEQFLEGAYAVLKTEGTLIIQIINYDRILDRDIKELPTIINDRNPELKAEFIRKYEKMEASNLLDFHTRLTIEQRGEKKVFENHTPLLPIRHQELKDLFEQAGFRNIESYSNFMEEDYDPQGQPLIMTGKKL